MKLGIPRLSEPITQSGLVTTRPWFNFFHEIITSLGHSTSVTIYSEKTFDLLSANQSSSTIAAFGSYRAVEFANGSTTDCYMSWVLPNNYIDGTDLTAFVEWAPSTTNTGDAVWRVTYDFASDSELWGSSTVSLTVAANGTASARQTSTLGDIDGAALSKGMTGLFKLSRIGGDAADTFTGSAYGISLGLKFRVQGVGHEVQFP